MPTASPSFSEVAADARLNALIDRLTSLDAGGAWVVSAYLRLEPVDRQRRKYLIGFKNRVKESLEAFAARDPSRAARAQVRKDLDRIQAHIEEPGHLPAGRGLAIFACGPRRLFEAVPLAHVFRARLAIDRTPLVRELQAVRDEFGRVLCVVTDRTRARIYVVTAAGAEEATSIVAPGTAESAKFHGGRQRQTTGARGRVVGVSGVGEHNWHQRILGERHRHYATIAERLFALTRRQPIEGIVLAGLGKDVAALRPHLHPYVQDLVLGTARLNPQTVESGQVADAVLQRRREREREWEERHVSELQEALATGWGVAGVGPTLDALARGQVRTLLVAADATASGFRCATSGRLTILPDDCRGEGDATPLPDVVDEAIEDALRQSAHVDVIEDDAAGARVDGLGALLRFPRR